MLAIYGPPAARVRWVEDDESYDPGDTLKCDEHMSQRDPVPGCEACAECAAEIEHYVTLYGVLGCIVETRGPACPCCERPGVWEHATSCWGIVGDDAYRRDIETDLLMEV